MINVSSDGTFDYTVEDYYGNIKKSGTVLGNGTPSRETINLSDKLDCGYYDIVVHGIVAGENRPVSRTSISIVEDYKFETDMDTSKFGINSHIGQNYYGYVSDLLRNEIKKLGTQRIRDAYYWHDIEKTKGTISVDNTALLYGAYTNKIDLLMTGGYKNSLYMGEDEATPTTDSAIEGFANYGKGLCAAFSSNFPLKQYEVWNEYWGWDSTDSSMDKYIKLFNKSYDTVKADYPHVLITTCFTNRDTPTELLWNEKIMESDVSHKMDIATIHCYGGTQNDSEEKRPEIVSSVSGSVDDLRELMAKNGVADKDIWLTETGYSTFPIDLFGKDIKPEKAGALSNKFCISEKEAAMYLPRLILIALSKNIDKIYTYQLLDHQYDLSTHESFYGLLRHSDTVCGLYSPKPEYSSYAALIRALDNTEFISASINNACYEYKFGSESKTVTAVYSIDGAMAYSYASDVPVTVTDIMGNSTEIVPKNGEITIMIDENVKYICSNDL